MPVPDGLVHRRPRLASLTDLLADRVMVDYSSTFGDPAVEVSARSFVRTLSSVLDHLTATQHLVASHVVAADGDGATCVSNVQATSPRQPQQETRCDAAGKYKMTFSRTLRVGVSPRRLLPGWATGNREVMRLAGRI